jgi:drug/metabolite transporter (DMT)-like permease
MTIKARTVNGAPTESFIPIVALLLSTLVEHLRWDRTMIAGIALCLAGNLIVLSRNARPQILHASK